MLSFVTAYPHLKNKLAEVLTDGLRAQRLRTNGYRVAVLELTDPENTPKNTLIRAVLRGGDTSTAQEDYEKALACVLGEGADTYLKDL